MSNPAARAFALAPMVVTVSSIAISLNDFSCQFTSSPSPPPAAQAFFHGPVRADGEVQRDGIAAQLHELVGILHLRTKEDTRLYIVVREAQR